MPAMPTTPIAVAWAAEPARYSNHQAACSLIAGTKLRKIRPSSSCRTGAKFGKTDKMPSTMTPSGTSETSVV